MGSNFLPSLKKVIWSYQIFEHTSFFYLCKSCILLWDCLQPLYLSTEKEKRVEQEGSMGVEVVFVSEMSKKNTVDIFRDLSGSSLCLLLLPCY